MPISEFLQTSHIPLRGRFNGIEYANDTGETHIRLGNGAVVLFDRASLDNLIDALLAARQDMDEQTARMFPDMFEPPVADSETPLARAQRFMGESA